MSDYGIPVLILGVIFVALWIFSARQKRKHEDRMRELRRERKENLARLKAQHSDKAE